MANIVYPKTWVLNEILTSSDLNAEFAAVSAVVNGDLDDGNIAANAGIKGSKLADAPNGITAAKINDGVITDAKIAAGAGIQGTKLADQPNGITVGKLNVGSTSRVRAHDSDTPGGGITTEVTLLTALVGSRGGPIRIAATVSGSITPNDEGISTTVTLRLKRDGVLLNDGTNDVVFTQSATWNTSGGGVPPVPPTFPFAVTIYYIDVPAAGSYTYTVTAEKTNGNGSVAQGYVRLSVEEGA